MRLLTAEEILSADDTEFAEVPTPQWGEGTGVRVRSLTAAERGRWEASMQAEGKKKADFQNARARLVMMAAVDAQGGKLFQSVDQLERLSRKNSGPISQICEKILEISGVSDEDAEELEKNSGKTAGGSSPTG